MKRPIGVTILAVLAIVYASVQLLFVLVPILGISVNLLAAPFGAALTDAGVFGLTLGIVAAAAAITGIVFGAGALMMRPWAWVLGMLGFGLSALVSLIQVVTYGVVSGPVVSLIVSVGILLYLTTHGVRVAFDHEDGSLFHSGHHGAMSA